jgi:hypothetical protein
MYSRIAAGVPHLEKDTWSVVSFYTTFFNYFKLLDKGS